MDERATILKIEKLGRTACEHCGEILDVAEFRVFEEIECPVCNGLLTVPGQFGNYYLLQELGRGGMGSVFLARDAQLNRLVALKVLNPTFGQDAKFVEDLLREAKAAAALNHKNIVHLYSYGQENGQPYMVMELVDGIRLDECIDPETPQDEIGWLDVLLQLCHGLADAERKGVIHGDIKPANILMDEQGNTKLSDFGIARVTGDHDDRILGTPLYIAPEKTKRQRADSRSDQFSLGATFWHILSGYPPFPGKTSKDVVLRRFEAPQPDIRDYAPQLSPATAFLLRKMMSTEPEGRFPSFTAVAAEVEEIIADLEEETLLEEQHREDLEEEARELHCLQVKSRILVVGCVLMLTLIGYIYLAFYT